MLNFLSILGSGQAYHACGSLQCRAMLKDWIAPIAAGFICVLVGYSSSAAIVFQATQALGATPAQTGSWMLALGLGMAALCAGLSIAYRVPVVTAWSTPGAALLATSLSGVPIEQAIGAFVFSAALTILFGVTGWFERAISRIPQPLASALLAGVLVRFGLEAFAGLKTRFGLVLAMMLVWLLGKRLWPRYAVIGVLLVGVCAAAATGLIAPGAIRLELARPQWTTPQFSIPVLLGVGVPLFVVTMASQNVPGVAVLRAAGYTSTPISPLISWTGITTLLLAPFGGFTFNLAAITAAICIGPQAHEDPSKRWRASVAAGFFYLVLAIFGATVALLFAALPRELIAAIAGLALIPTIAAGLAGATAEAHWREPALVTFLLTASGVSFAGVGAAFWALLAGLATALALGVWRKVG
jgi:benzoate membrane transport protein